MTDPNYFTCLDECSFNPKTADNFVIVIDGIGSHGNPEKEGQVDNIMETTIKQIMASGGTIASARFYSSSGVRNLLKHQLLQDKEKG